jgi:GTPase SAR1 family protein
MKKYIVRKGKRNSEIKSLIKQMHFKEIKEDDYFVSRSLCVVGAYKEIESYRGNIPDEHLVGWKINKSVHLNLGLIGSAGVGKTRLIKNLEYWYYKAGYKVINICPKNDEYSSAKFKGDGFRLHKEMQPRSLPVSTYCASYVKNFLELNGLKTTGYKFYSPSIKNFNTKEVWESLGLSTTASNYAVSLINQGTTKLRDLRNKLMKGNLIAQSKSPALNKIDNMIGTKFINDRLGELDLEQEWDINNNVISINYFSQEGSLMSTDIWLIVDKVRRYCQKKISKGEFQPILIVFDDANLYASGESHNLHAIKSIVNVQNNFRSLGMNLIVSYQHPDTVVRIIRNGNTKYLLSYIPNPEALGGLITSEDLYLLKAKESDGGLKFDSNTYTVEWVLVEGRDIQTFFPFGCMVGHK